MSNQREKGRDMIHSFVAPMSDRLGFVLRGVLVLLMCGLVSAVAGAQSQQPQSQTSQSQALTIRIINANTGHPVTDERLNVALRADQIGSVAMPTDKNGIISVDYGKATTIRILSNMYADCRSRGELYTNYPIASILQKGLVTGNLCPTTATPTAKPGELVLFEIPRTFVPTMRP
ncbi:hypothetical protein [Granulicella sp. L60]|uniref:hypothetical protein n=1 Tax=Granulicella sp. L60 TaxID=1641866 RepID=UPI00131C384E|nr:hypothetical protein [Granulicella sp. L60]